MVDRNGDMNGGLDRNGSKVEETGMKRLERTREEGKGGFWDVQG